MRVKIQDIALGTTHKEIERSFKIYRLTLSPVVLLFVALFLYTKEWAYGWAGLFVAFFLLLFGLLAKRARSRPQQLKYILEIDVHADWEEDAPEGTHFKGVDMAYGSDQYAEAILRKESGEWKLLSFRTKPSGLISCFNSQDVEPYKIDGVWYARNPYTGEEVKVPNGQQVRFSKP